MSGDDNFLLRWSRRKADAASSRHAGTTPAHDDRHAPGRDRSGEDRARHTVAAGEAPLDLASLPPIESIAAGSDIRAFLAAGVPADLARAALRRAWSSDPAIRDFIGLSENSFDFNSSAVAGFGQCDSEQIARLLDHLTGETRTTVEGHAATTLQTNQGLGGVATEVDLHRGHEHETSGPSDPPACSQVQHDDCERENILMQRNTSAPAGTDSAGETRAPEPRRRHGSALPR